MDNIERGDIYYYTFSDSVGSEQKGGRPAIIVSNNVGNHFSGNVTIVPVTTQPKKDMPTHVGINATGIQSTALCESVTTISKERLGGYCATCSYAEMQAINAALMVQLGIEADSTILPTSTKCTNAEITQQDGSDQATIKAERDVYKRLLDKILERAPIWGGTDAT